MTTTLRHIVFGALIAVSATGCALAKPLESIDLTYAGDLAELVPKLHQVDPRMNISITGTKRDVPVTVKVSNSGKVDILRAIGEQAGDKADLTYIPSSNSLRIAYRELPKPVVVAPPPPVERMADGSVVVTFGKARPELVCQAQDPCAIELEVGEKINRLDVGDPKRWEVSPAVVGEGDTRAIVVIVRASESMLRTKLVLTTNRRIYSIRLTSPDKVTEEADSRMSFRYAERS
jgi:hypothetical protein